MSSLPPHFFSNFQLPLLNERTVVSGVSRMCTLPELASKKLSDANMSVLCKDIGSVS